MYDILLSAKLETAIET